MQKTLARNVAAAHISQFLSNRPSAQDLVRHKVMQGAHAAAVNASMFFVAMRENHDVIYNKQVA